MLEPRERGPVGSRSLHGSRCGGIVVPVEAHEPTEAAVWLDAMAQSLRAGAADGAAAGRNAWLMRGGTCGVASWRQGSLTSTLGSISDTREAATA